MSEISYTDWIAAIGGLSGFVSLGETIWSRWTTNARTRAQRLQVKADTFPHGLMKVTATFDPEDATEALELVVQTTTRGARLFAMDGNQWWIVGPEANAHRAQSEIRFDIDPGLPNNPVLVWPKAGSRHARMKYRVVTSDGRRTVLTRVVTVSV